MPEVAKISTLISELQCNKNFWNIATIREEKTGRVKISKMPIFLQNAMCHLFCCKTALLPIPHRAEIFVSSNYKML